MYVFISHSSTDATIAQEICSTLETSNIQCFLAPRDIRSGYEYASEILYGLDRSDILLLLLSNKANQSPHVLREVERAVSNATPIIVYKLEDVELTKSMEYFLMTHQWLNAEHGNYTNLVSSIQEFQKNKGEEVKPLPPVPVTEISNPAVKVKKNILPWIVVSAVFIALVVIIFIMLLGKNSYNTLPKDETTNLVQNNTSDDRQEISSSTSSNSTEGNETNKETEETSTSSQNAVTDIALGDTLVMGNYNGADIEWIVIHINENENSAVVISKNILSFKAFSGSKSSEFALGEDGNHYFFNDPAVADDLEQQEYLWGSNIWKNSHIRTWLNSDSGIVEYEGSGPLSLTMADHSNGYNTEAGFLTSFTAEELAAIKETTVKTAGNALTGDETITTTDKVFLLSKDELSWLTDAGLGLFTAPTKEAIDLNFNTFYEEYCLDVFKTNNCLWWLRDPLENSVSECYLISHGAKANRDFENALVAVEGYGIRPAMTIDLGADLIN